MAAKSASKDSDKSYRSRHGKLPTIHRKVDALQPKARAVTLDMPKDYSKGLNRPARQPTVSRHAFDTAHVDEELKGVKFTDGGRARAAPKPKAKPKPEAKKPAKKVKPAKKAKTTAGKPAAKKPAKKSVKKAARKPVKKSSKAPARKDLRPQCAAATPQGKQCRNSARDGSKYCGSHKGFHPSKASAKAKDTTPRVKRAKDTTPAKRKVATSKNARCAAKTADGKRCKNSSRDSSKYCGSHKGYRP